MPPAMRLLDGLPRILLAHLPTPLEELQRLEVSLGGPRIFIKRDDQTGLAFGGNKTRKLEFLIADALRNGATTVVTAGSAQSNHCRQTAAAAARAGLHCELVLGGEETTPPTGNVLLDHVYGARIHWTGMERRGERLAEVADEVRSRGERPYLIPYGGSNPVGAIGYVVAMLELMDQLKERHLSADCIFFASSSGGTHAGLTVGARAAGYAGALIGISIDKGERSDVPYEEELADLSTRTAARAGMDARFVPGDFVVKYDYLGGGYGVMGELERDAIALLARTEGILLDPVYTGRAAGAMIDMVRRGDFSPQETVVFIHTGGGPALFAYASGLTPAGPPER